ncbi:MAG: tRNA (adenosine(37)-N6)-threonylcarbamoyltransferase complex ATPase subunit type 1 TsaE [Anaerolineae bacterium]|nr:tRNA (adenosine(37)-N6)-threonylcarbamoyltransferase complex ATPase subunit type 1 TsaE [Anaerolineae bacterium]
MRFTSQNVEHTVQVGTLLGGLLAAGDVICLSGNLGAGKTAFTRGIAAGWRALERVTSPTFTLVHEHRRAEDNQTLYHVDCYRLHSEEDAWGIGLDDLLHGDGVVVIEWPEHIETTLPDHRLWIAFDIAGETQRQITVTAAGERYRELLDALRAKLPDLP